MTSKVRERQAFILEYLSQNSSVSVAQLSALCGVSPVTIRRELMLLEGEGKLVRFHGGAQLKRPVEVCADVSEFDSKALTMQDEKQRIGAKACEYISGGATVFMNSGTSVLEFLRQLQKKDVTVVTNNTAALTCPKSEDVSLLLAGGFYQARTRSVCGDVTTACIRGIYSSCTVLGANAIDLNAGITTGSMYESTVNSAMIANTRGRVIILADHTKMRKTAGYRSATLEQVDIIITDAGCPPDIVKALQQAGVQVELV